MANNFIVSEAAVDAMCDALVDLCEGGTPPAIMRILTGAQPADPDTAQTGTLLATLTFSNPAFGAAAVGGGIGLINGVGVTLLRIPPLED